MSSLKAFVLVATLIMGAAIARGSEPTYIDIGRGRLSAMKPTEDAEKQLAAGDLKGAQKNVADALQRDPEFWPAIFVRARLFATQGKWQSALQDCNQIVRMAPTFIPAALLRAKANAALGNNRAALKEYDYVISLRPAMHFYQMALADRAWFLASCPDASLRNGRKAIDDAKQACSATNWREADPIDTLACAYAEAGDFDSAIKYAQRAAQAKDAHEMSKTLEAHLALFKKHQAVRSR